MNVWVGEGFFPEFPQTFPKSFCAIFANKYSITKIAKISFWCDLQKQVFRCVFLQTSSATFCSQNRWVTFQPGFLGILSRFQEFFPDFHGFCPDYRQMKTLGYTCSPCTPAFYTTGWSSPQAWTLGPPMSKTLHLMQNIYMNKTVDLF